MPRIALKFRNRKLVTWSLIVLIVWSPSNLAFAWSEGGHHVIALIAYNLLSKEEQAKFQSILGNHPRYEEDFSPKKDLPNEVEVLRWKAGRAAYWPDVARKQPKFHRSTWHYELGPTAILGNASSSKVPERPGPLPVGSTVETQELYIAQALHLCRDTVASRASSDQDRAIALCWIMHLVGDSHQPCHAGSLYMEGVFEKSEGDRGANSLPTKQKKNMHALWDQLLGEDFTLNGTRKRVLEITEDKELAKFADTAMAGDDALDPQRWLRESRDLAKQHVYTPEVLASLQTVQRGLVDKPETIDLNEEYLKQAGRVAQMRAIQAGHRLAAVLKECMD